MKFHKLILLFLSIWFVLPKYGNANPSQDFSRKSIIKEFPSPKNISLLFSISDFDLEDDDDIEKNNLLQPSLYSVLYYSICSLTTKENYSPIFYTINSLGTNVATYLLVRNFRI